MATGVQPAKLEGRGVVIRKDGTREEFKFESAVPIGQEQVAQQLVADFNKRKEDSDNGGNA